MSHFSGKRIALSFVLFVLPIPADMFDAKIVNYIFTVYER